MCLEYHHESFMFEHIWLVLLDYQLHPHLELELCEIFHEDCGLLEWLGLGFEDLAPSLSSFNFRKVQIWPRTFPLCNVSTLGCTPLSLYKPQKGHLIRGFAIFLKMILFWDTL